MRVQPLGAWLGDVDADGLQVVRTAEYTFTSALADTWRVGPLLIAGDAAHLTPPFIGQGLGAGLRDANNVAWKLAGVVDGSLDVDVLDTYQTERQHHTRAMIGLATVLGAVMTGGGATGDRARRAFARPLASVINRFDMAAAGTTPRLRSGPWVQRAGDRLAGRLCPSAGIRIRRWTLVRPDGTVMASGASVDLVRAVPR